MSEAYHLRRREALRAIGRMYGERDTTRIASLKIEGVIGFDENRKSQGLTALEVEARLAVHGKLEEINLFINSNGGRVAEARKIHDVLRATGAWINGTVVGTCASAAVTVLLAADWREARPGSRILIHEPALTIDDLPAMSARTRWTAAHHKSIARLLEKSEAQKLSLYAKRTSSSLEVLRREIKNPADREMSLHKAMALGFIHAVAGQTIWHAGRPYAFPNSSDYR